jgi:hypothetical protein
LNAPASDIAKNQSSAFGYVIHILEMNFVVMILFPGQIRIPVGFVFKINFIAITTPIKIVQDSGE